MRYFKYHITTVASLVNSWHVVYLTTN